MVSSGNNIFNTYGNIAKNYDRFMNFFYLLGFRDYTYRKIAVDKLGLKSSDTVIDVCCGTGRNFRFLQEKIGKEGKIIGLDMSPHMLEQAGRRIVDNSWKNVTLVEGNALDYQFPGGVNGVISTYAIGLIPEYDTVIHNVAKALSPRGRFVIMDPQYPKSWPQWMQRLGIYLFIKPFADEETLLALERYPFESVKKYFNSTLYEEFYFGAVYLAIGECPSPIRTAV